MNDASSPHPEEALAAYVDGSAGADERALSEAHLRGCATCREEVGLAQLGMAAVAALPELESPGLRWQRDGVPDVRDATEAWTGGARWWQRVGERWAAGVAAAAAAVIVVVLAVGVLLPGNDVEPNRSAVERDSGATTGATAAPEASGAAAPLQNNPGTNHDERSIQRLATDLAQGPAPAYADSPAGADAGFEEARTAATCVRSSAGLPPGAAPIYLERARFKGDPAYVGAFTTSSGEDRALLAVATSVDGCRALYLYRRAL